MSTSLNPHLFSTSTIETIEAEKNHSTFAASKGKELTTTEMNENISETAKSKLTECLSENWRKLAEVIPLPPIKIEKIDKDQTKPTEKAKCVLDYWEQLSPHTYNVNSIKMKLQSIQLYDIVAGVFGEVVPKVEDLSYNEILQLANLLDPDNGWEEVGNCLFKNDKEFLKTIEAFQYDYAGGGNPVNEFLKVLLQRRPSLTMNEFVLVCKEAQREDVILYATENFRNIDLIRHLNLNQLKHFASVIRGNIVPSNWPDIASRFKEFSNDDIKKLDRERVIPNSYSPTIRLFEKLQQSHPKLELRNLINACETVKMNRVANKLREFAENKK